MKNVSNKQKISEIIKTSKLGYMQKPYCYNLKLKIVLVLSKLEVAIAMIQESTKRC